MASRYGGPVLPLVVMGVAGCGKSSVASVLAPMLRARFVEGDEFHSPDAVAKMAAGLALDEDDRRPWLEALAGELRRGEPAVLACSALRRAYRDVLRAGGARRFVLLSVPRAEIERRLARRLGHFAGPALVSSQFGTLELPALDERDVLVVDGAGDPEVVVARVRATLGGR